MADDKIDKIKNIIDGDKGNINMDFNVASSGMNMDNSISQVAKGQLTYALNASVENFDANSVTYQNEQGNEFCLQFPTNYLLIGKHLIAEKNKHIFFIANPDTGDSEIGYMDNNDCIYHTLVNAKCLNFNIHYPIHKVVHKITNCTTEIYWTDGFNPRRYLDITPENLPWKLLPGSSLCNPLYDVGNLDCNQLKIQPNFNIPELSIKKIVSGGNLIAGTYQFAIQYSDASGNPYTSFYSVTNPCPIADVHTTSNEFNYQVGRSINVNISNLDASGEFNYFNLAVIKTINGSISVNLIGTYSIDAISKTITYTGEDVTSESLSINDIFEKYPYYDIAQDLTAVQDVLVWDNLTSIDRINYQSIASQITLQWETYKLPATENYSDGFNATNLRGYLRDEVYAFEIVFLLRNGKQTDGFHIPGRIKNSNDSFPDVPDTNSDFIGEPDYYVNDPVTGKKIGYSPYWKIYNTATVIGPGDGLPIGNATPYQYGDMAYWESTEKYSCNVDLWGDLADQPIRHHKFPDILVSPAFESAPLEYVGNKYKVTMQQNDAVFPLGVKLVNEQVILAINNSNLTEDQKADIVGFKIVRGNRDTNKSIIAKGILRNVGKYSRENQDYYFPNYPYNDVTPDPFLLGITNAYLTEYIQNGTSSGIADVWLVICTADGEYLYVDSITGETKANNIMKAGEVYEFCSLIRPIRVTGEASIGPANYDGGYSTYTTSAGQYLYISAYSSFSTTNTDGTLLIKHLGGSMGYLPIGTIPTIDNGENINNYGQWFVNPPVTCDIGQLPPDEYYLWEGEQILITKGKYRGRRSKITCNNTGPITISSQDSAKYRQVFNSPETSFGQPFLGNILKLENVIFGAGTAHHVQVKKNAKYRLLSKEAQQDALDSCYTIANITSPLDMAAMFTAYQTYLQIYINGILRKNYAYSYNSIASYDYSADIQNGIGIKQRELDLKQYLIPVVQSVGDNHGINNYERETSVYLKTIEKRNNNPVASLSFPSQVPSLFNGTDSYIEDKSRYTISDFDNCKTVEKEKEIKVVSYYASLKNEVVNQWGQMYSYNTVDTGCQQIFNSPNFQPTITIFGGDTFISRFAFKTKLPFFTDNRVGSPDDSDIFYDELGNVAYPKYWHSARSILYDYQSFKKLISIKAHNFDCPNNPASVPASVDGAAGTYRTYYDGYFYLFAYDIPNFYCESSYNTDLRQAYNNREGDFWPHVSTSIPDDWLQETFVPITFDNTYHYNPTYSKQNKENYFSHLPPDWENKLCFTNYPFRAIYSDAQDQNSDIRVNNWLSYSATSLFDFPQNYGKLVSLDGIENKAILARFENKSLLYNKLLTMDSSNPQAAYLGGTKLFGDAPPIDFAETDLGYVGSQNKLLLKIPNGQITIDAKRGQIFLINNGQNKELSAFGSGMNRFFTDHLAFEILRYYPDVDVDNNFTGIGLHAVYDSKFDRIIITKLDYIPLDNDIKYDAVKKEFYLEYYENDVLLKTQVYLTDTEFFCNKSWTISYNMNTGGWTSFHSYIPNFYIAENNFFYSGLNGCCDDLNIESGFTALVGDTDKPEPTTTTTTTGIIITTTTTSTTENKNCVIEATVVLTSCDLAGTAVITVDPIPTTTRCQQPSNLNQINLVTGYILNSITEVTIKNSYEEACAALPMIELSNNADNTEVSLQTFPGFIFAGTPILGEIVYNNLGNSCDVILDGWYYIDVDQRDYNIYHVVNGIIVEISNCDCGTTTTTTTLPPNIEECCGSIVTVGNDVYYFNQNPNMQLINVPGYTSSLGIAMTANYLWSIDTTIKQWDISLLPFSATYNKEITFPVGFTTSNGIVAKNENILIAIDDSSAPLNVVELDITETIATSTVMFTLQADRILIGNMIYTIDGKFIIINQDTLSSSYYLTQYDYATYTIEYDIDITDISPSTLYQCECTLNIIDTLGQIWIIEKTDPFTLLPGSEFSIIPGSITQVSTCSTAEIPLTTTTTTTV